MFHPKRTAIKLLSIFILLAVLFGLPGCIGVGPESSPSPTAFEATPSPEPEVPSFVPEKIDLPDSYGFIELATSGLKSKALKYYHALRNDLFLKEGLRYGFCGKLSFEYSYVDSRLAPVAVEGVLYAPLEGLAKAFGADYSFDGETVTLTYAGTGCTVSVSESTVKIGDETLAFRKPQLLNGVYYADARNLALLFDYTTETEEEIIHMTAKERTEKENVEDAKALFTTYANEIYGDTEVSCDTTGSGLYTPVDPKDRLVGVAYTTWFRTDSKWGTGHTWDIPLLGGYNSLDRTVIRQHGIWLRDAGVDFVFVDWSNDVNYDPATMRKTRADFRTIEEATEALFDVWADIPGAPKICIFTGPGHEQGRNGADPLHNGRMDAKTQQIYDTFLVNDRYREMYFEYEGKPLLLCYAATPAFFQDNVSPYEDDRFTVRWITGYVGQQSSLFDKDTLVSKMFWSWEERGAQTFTVLHDQPECMTVNASTRSQGSTPGTAGYIAPALRDNGNTFKRAWARARLIGPKIVLVVSFNEWGLGEQISLENSKDIEPSKTLGSFYLDLMREEIRKFKSPAAQ